MAAGPLSRGSVNPRGRARGRGCGLRRPNSIDRWRCDGLPRSGYRRLLRAEPFTGMIRKAGLEWAARREDGQGAIHSPFWSITRRPQIPARPGSPPVRAYVLQPWTASGAHHPNSPGRGRTLRCGRITARALGREQARGLQRDELRRHELTSTTLAPQVDDVCAGGGWRVSAATARAQRRAI